MAVVVHKTEKPVHDPWDYCDTEIPLKELFLHPSLIANPIYHSLFHSSTCTRCMLYHCFLQILHYGI